LLVPEVNVTIYNNKPLLAVLFLTSLSFSSITSPFYINDSSGNLGEVNVATRQVRVIGSMGVTLTDIAFDPRGNLYGLSSSAFYRIDPQTAAITLIGRHGIPCGNALEFDDNGTLFATGCSTTSLFTVDIATGVATPFGNMGFSSRGDLAFNNGTLYLAASNNQLVRIDLANGAVGTAVGPFGFRSVFGLDTDTNRALFGFSHTTVLSVNLSTGVGTPVFDYGGHGLGRANGASFPGPPPPPQSVADLALSITDTPDPVTVGTTLTYTLLVSNNGPAAAAGVVLTDTLPSGVNVVSIPPSCSGTSTVTCNLTTLASDASDTVDIVVTPTVAGTITNTAIVTANEIDPDASNNTTIGQLTSVVSAPPPPQSVPVVLIHGFLGNPGSFGSMGDLLERDVGVAVEPFDYGEFTQGPSNVTIEELAGLFSFHIRQVLENHPEARSVDVVAHSMGGLITRAWMSGMTETDFCPTCVQIPYEGQIRRLILVGTPNYGAEGAILRGACAFSQAGCSLTQAGEMRFGSSFIATLHDKWEEFQQSNNPYRVLSQNLLFIAGTQASNRTQRERVLFECNDVQGCDDGVVDISSAVLPASPTGMIRYLPYRHFPGNLPKSALTLVGVTERNHRNHQTYRLVRAFLKNNVVLGQCCGRGTVGYNPPHLRGVRRKKEGLLLVRLIDAVTHEPITVGARIILRPRRLFRQQNNRSAGTITAWGIMAPRKYDIILTPALSYAQVRLDDAVQMNIAHPTVLGPIELSP
jgi:uncharacterized repeat protein (TIGR01451 family)